MVSFAPKKVEETIQVFDFLNQNKALYRRQRKPY
jgi:hypothetical protein